MPAHFLSLRLCLHPVIEHKLTHLRDKETSVAKFQQLMRELGTFLAYEATRDLPLEPKEVDTPVMEGAAGQILACRKSVVTPILRAGLILAEGMLYALPGARTGHIGLRRDKKTFDVSEYLVALPDPRDRLFLVADPMIATGNTACRAVKILHEEVGIPQENIRVCAVLVAPRGMTQLGKKYPGVQVYALSLEQGLDGEGRIIPGLGDAGDRLFGTKS